MADLESGSTVGGYPIIHEGNMHFVTKIKDVPDTMVSKSYANQRYSIVYHHRDGITPKDGDMLVENGDTISIYASGWRQIFPPLRNIR